MRNQTLRNGHTVDWLLDQLRATHTLIETSVFDIPQRLRDYDPTYFILRNHMTEKFEVHNTENLGNTYCLTIPYDELDVRTLDLVRSTDTQRIGAKIRRRQIEEESRKAEEAHKKKVRNEAERIARETASDIKKTCATL